MDLISKEMHSNSTSLLGVANELSASKHPMEKIKDGGIELHFQNQLQNLREKGKIKETKTITN